MTSTFTRRLLLAAAALAVSTGASATATDGVTLYYGSTYKIGGLPSGQITYSPILTVGPYGAGGPDDEMFGTTSLASGPVAFASVSSTGNHTGQYVMGDMMTSLFYNFEVVGPTQRSVPLLINGRLGLAFSDTYASAGASAQVSVNVTDNYPYNSHSVASDSTPMTYCYAGHADTCNVGFELHVNVVSGMATQVGQIGTVVLTAEASFGAYYFDGASASAFADPLISIDPTFLAANPGYSLAFNEAVVNQLAPVPEPAGWALMLAGLGVVAGLRRRNS